MIYPVCYLWNGLGKPFEIIQMPQGPVYTTILFSLKTMESLQNGVATHFQVTPLLPPANEVWGKVIFSETCVKNSVHRGGACSRGMVPAPRSGAWSGGCLVLGVPGRDPPNGYCCGRYASYWNAFLFSMRTESQASSQSCRSVDGDAWCKWSLTDTETDTNSKRFRIDHGPVCYSSVPFSTFHPLLLYQPPRPTLSQNFYVIFTFLMGFSVTYRKML